MEATNKASYLLILALYIIATVVHISGLAANCNCQLALRPDTFVAITNMTLRCHAIRTVRNKSRLRCTELCINTDGCRSFNYDSFNGTCQLNDGRYSEYPADFLPDERFTYYDGRRATSSGTITNQVRFS